ncbi:hypothetical protein [Halorubrum vacuolatum]|uniref:Uncharacterized protein n=1 Tax=Halorubrum vacuolatum TaxID=63740 RepID=A0A238YCJ4_HALVU|nr:hypothetical protein [Halorubrum vacuolatum]SNR68857.1 hypothetical protein SAMN06264855_1386 [Halorubrum vacuolatum]
MPPDGYTSVTISDETAAKLAEIMGEQDLDSIAEAIDYAADATRDPEALSEVELARLLHHKLAD